MKSLPVLDRLEPVLETGSGCRNFLA